MPQPAHGRRQCRCSLGFHCGGRIVFDSSYTTSASVQKLDAEAFTVRVIIRTTTDVPENSLVCRVSWLTSMAPASPLPLLFLLLSSVLGLSQIQLSTYQSQIGDGLGLSFPLFEQPDCECFNCNLDQFQCQQFANCSKANGKCSCPPGFGGDACSEPLCGSLADGKDRAPRPPDQSTCTCKEGWEGINCNVCKDDRACDSLMPEGKDGVCYKEGVVQHENFQMCDITNRKIIDQLDPRIPQATFSCNREREVCSFQCKRMQRSVMHSTELTRGFMQFGLIKLSHSIVDSMIVILTSKPNLTGTLRSIVVIR